MKEIKALKSTLDGYYRTYPFEERVLHDPIEFPRRYKKPADAEVAGLIATSFAYGKVTLFKPVVERILQVMGNSPSAYLMRFDLRKARRAFRGISYRFSTEADVLCLLYVMSRVLREHGSLEAAFMKGYEEGHHDIGPALDAFMHRMREEINTRPVYGNELRPQGFTHFFPMPSGGGACKRGCLYARWMVRDRDIDLGIWKGIPKGKLVIPLDTHIARISRCLGFVTRASNGWKTAVEITDALRRLDPEDPLKYDFALCHHGISGLCRPDRSGCSECGLKTFG